ncbi:MAG TPA: DUF3618 domain-containing protein [Streptomyces sp.]|jgi:hypothetical protein|nr:DUF3618 domain-containing protein [Streptomyces sp.]
MTHKSGAGSSTDSRQLRAEVEQAREQLAETVSELAAKADVKAHAREIAAQAKSKALFEANEARIRVQHTAEQAAHRGYTKPGPAVAVVAGVGLAALATFVVLHRQREKR